MTDEIPFAGGSEPPARCLNAVRSLMRALRVNSREIEGKIGMSLAQVFVLEELAERPADSLGEIAARTATHQSSVSMVLKRLVAGGFVARTAHPRDQRRLQFSITPPGSQMLVRTPKTIQVRLIAALGTIAPADQTRLADLLERWLTVAEIDHDSPPMLLEDAP
ncbi:MAG TPA: MarR family transcriptional regulator [Gemmatimonadaceae bacterium]